MFFAIAVVAASLHGLASSSGRAATLSSSRQRDGGRRAGRYTSLGEAAVDARMVAAVATDPRVRLELERVSKMQWFIPHWRPRCFQPPRPSDYAASPRRRGRRRGPSLTHSAAPRETVATPRPPIAKASTSDLSRNTWSLKVEKQLLVGSSFTWSFCRDSWAAAASLYAARRRQGARAARVDRQLRRASVAGARGEERVRGLLDASTPIPNVCLACAELLVLSKKTKTLSCLPMPRSLAAPATVVGSDGGSRQPAASCPAPPAAAASAAASACAAVA